ncbi:lipid A biosynthesis lauroyl acyltransferase [Centipeda periodontii DSM 2778]|uniref:Lipid A biosynthesis lauroyl acyltransferase n=1 Tax=Centipeda periodontii DSM 2778 TaxID=888060 RepID=F5RKJ5_9FIRM|nr:lysophospholipid acyltransferase family protein [Centipeda periodontii]EGK60923.1 lipid A biosynthesis lauroyl acyltransferase [Centipeda periodontii DSM 2778]
MFSYYAVKLLSCLICLLPHGAAMMLGQGLARLAWIFVPKKRKTLAREQVMRCLSVSAAEAERIARASSLRFGPMLMEVLRFPVMKGRMDDYVTITGAIAEVRAAVAAGKGAIFATSHSGNWELMGGAFACAGLPIVGVAKRQSAAGMDRFINEYRALVGMHITYQTGVREMFRMIDAGWIIGLISDQDPSLRDGIIIDFFGQPTNAFTGAAAIARRCGVPIFPVFIHREESGHHILTVEPGIMVEKTDDRTEDVRRVTQTINTRIEQWIRKYPEEWFWLHDRWKSLREE